jgi:hypothetical protein
LDVVINVISVVGIQAPRVRTVGRFFFNWSYMYVIRVLSTPGFFFFLNVVGDGVGRSPIY